MTAVATKKRPRKRKVAEPPKPIFNDEFDSYVRAHVNRNFGRPDNITSENLMWYRGWDHGGAQRGRMDVWHWVMNKDGYKDVKITSYFIKVFAWIRKYKNKFCKVCCPSFLQQSKF